MAATFKALVLDQKDGKTTQRLTELSPEELPEGEVLVRIGYSTLNYKDALAITGAGKIVRDFPFVPGIDFAGHVAQSSDERFKDGDEVLLTGYGVGERHWGGLAEYARVKADWLVPLPEGLSLAHAMSIGTAGFTAMLCVLALEEQGVAPEAGEVVVTGAAGGVGSTAVALLAKAGFKPVAATGREEEHAYLEGLGAARIVGRSTFTEESKRPLEKAAWAGAVDTVGGAVLANLLKTIAPGGAVAACGNAGGIKVETTVLPFILRGVRLIGIDSVNVPMERRKRAWQRLASDLDRAHLEAMTETIGLDEVIETAPRFLEGRVRGRVLVAIGEG